MKKKLLSVLLSTAMVASLLVGCGSSAATDDSAAADDSAATDAAATDTADCSVGIRMVQTCRQSSKQPATK